MNLLGRPRSRAERAQRAKARAHEQEENTFSPAAWWTMLAATFVLLAVAAAALWSGFAEPLLREDDLVNRIVNPERVAYEADAKAVALHANGRVYRLPEPLWRSKGDGAEVAAALPTGQAAMLWIPRADTSATSPRVVAIESAALTVPVATGLREVQASVRASRWGGLAALGLVGYAVFLLATRRRRPTDA